MKISVIIPSYKPKDYIWECLDSLVKQTFNKDYFEIILVLNGCSEPWKQEIEDYISSNMQGMNIIFIQTDTPGVSNARNIALDNVKGEYVTFIDDDDFVSPTFLQELYDKVTPDTVSLCYPFAFNDGNTSIQLPYRITEAYNFCIKKNITNLSSKVIKFFSGPCMKLIPTSFIQDRRYDVRFKNGEDSLFMFLISDKINKVSFTSKNTIYYRRYRENSAVTSKRKLIDTIKLIFEYTIIWCKSPKYYSFSFYINNIFSIIKICIVNIIKIVHKNFKS